MTSNVSFDLFSHVLLTILLPIELNPGGNMSNLDLGNGIVNWIDNSGISSYVPMLLLSLRGVPTLSTMLSGSRR